MFEDKLQFAKLKGKVLRSIRTGDGPRVEFHLSDGSVYALEYPRRAGEASGGYEYLGDIAALIGAPLLAAELSTCEEDFGAPFQPVVSYKLRTVNGSVAIRLAGELTGFYSVAADFLTLRDPLATAARGSVAPTLASASNSETPSERPVYDLGSPSQNSLWPRPAQAFRVRFSITSQAVLKSKGRRLAQTSRPYQEMTPPEIDLVSLRADDVSIRREQPRSKIDCIG